MQIKEEKKKLQQERDRVFPNEREKERDRGKEKEKEPDREVAHPIVQDNRRAPGSPRERRERPGEFSISITKYGIVILSSPHNPLPSLRQTLHLQEIERIRDKGLLQGLCPCNSHNLLAPILRTRGDPQICAQHAILIPSGNGRPKHFAPSIPKV